MDSFVWKVRINGEEPCYALKVFRFQSVGWLQETVGSYLTRPLKTSQLWVDYFEPFSCECRVYGRLKEEIQEDLAVRAHGYLLLTPEQELEVEKRSKPANPNDKPDDDPFCRRDEPLFSDRPVHAIVKDLATDQNHFTAADVEQMWNDVEDLHKRGIFIRDITVGNYLGGKLIDFSRAWTVPHPSLEHIIPMYLQRQRQRDPCDLQEAIFDFSTANGWWEEVDLPEALMASVVGENDDDGYGVDPRRYDWRKWESDLEAVDAFLEHDLLGPPYVIESWVPTQHTEDTIQTET